MIDHMGLVVGDFAVSRNFYVEALAPLGVVLLDEGKDWARLGIDGRTVLWIGKGGTPPSPIHFAFVAGSAEAVSGFHAAAIAAGGRDNGAPGLRSHYSPGYFAAFVFDPDGHNVEAVFHGAG